ncbi:MAG: hypothetical protein KC933_02635 [Myxococcales bacterium]|nr:hypothetical protein [Myxococcales bacterium]MCB9648922.1 hypothetical protein [Deltaproteobacteria bacterium]
MRRLALALALTTLTACAPTGALITRAAFDLDCPKDRLQLHDLGPSTKGVKGCGRKATYVWSCGTNQSCAWVMNSDIDATKTEQ